MKRKRNKFIEQSLVGIMSFFKESLFCEAYASKKGFLQSLDPRIKSITFLAFIVLAVTVKDIPVLFCLYLFCVLLALFSKTDIGFFLKRSLIFIPVFSLFIAMPAMFDFFTPGEAMWRAEILGLEIIITKPGFWGALLFVLRVLTSISFVVLLNLTTKHNALLKALSALNVARPFIMILNMAYRYVFMFIQLIENTYLALKSRTGGHIHYEKGQRIVSLNLANLWQRSYLMNNDVYSAMLAMGYKGEACVLEDFKGGIKDWVWCGFVIIFFIFTIYADRHF